MVWAQYRDGIAAEEQVIGFEIEGARFCDNFPIIVIKECATAPTATRTRSGRSHLRKRYARRMAGDRQGLQPSLRLEQVEGPPWT